MASATEADLRNLAQLVDTRFAGAQAEDNRLRQSIEEVVTNVMASVNNELTPIRDALAVAQSTLGEAVNRIQQQEVTVGNATSGIVQSLGDLNRITQGMQPGDADQFRSFLAAIQGQDLQQLLGSLSNSAQTISQIQTGLNTVQLAMQAIESGGRGTSNRGGPAPPTLNGLHC